MSKSTSVEQTTSVSADSQICWGDEADLSEYIYFYHLLGCGLAHLWHYVSLFLYPITVFTGIFGQIMTIVIMIKMRDWNSTCRVYYSFMAFFDLVYLLNFSLLFWLESVRRWVLSQIIGETFLYHSKSEFACGMYIHMYVVCIIISYWSLVLYAAERFIAIAFPFYRNRIGTMKKAFITCLSFVLFINLLYVPFMFSGIYDLKTYHESFGAEGCYINYSQSPAFFIIFFSISGFLLFSAPVILAVLNSCLFWKIKKHNKDTVGMIVQPRLLEQREKEENEAKNLIIVSCNTIFFSLWLLTWGILYEGMNFLTSKFFRIFLNRK